MHNTVELTSSLALAGFVGLVGSVGLVGCGDRSEAFEAHRSLMDPVAFNDRLVFVDPNNDEALILDVGKKALASETRLVALPKTPTQVVRRMGEHNEVLILSDGVLGDADALSEPAALSVLSDNGSLDTYELVNPFDTLIQSAGGRYVVLHSSGESDRLLGNDSQIALLDLDADDKDDVLTLKDLTNLGASPRQVIFSPRMQIAGEERRLAVILADRDVALLDLNHPEREETAAALTGNASRNIRPQQVLFDPDEPRLFVLASGADDVFVLRLNGPVENPGGNDFRPSIDLLGAGGRPQHMTLYQHEGQTRLLVSAGGQAVIVDVDSSSSTSVNLPSGANRSLVFQLEKETDEDDEPPPVGLMWAGGDNQLMFVDLDNIEARGDSNVEVTNRLIGSVDRVIPLPDEDRVLITHGEANGFSVLDLRTRTVTPISSNQSLSSAVFDIDSRRVWVAPRGQRSVGYLEIETGATAQVLLDESVETFVPLFSAGRLAIVHPSQVGHVTVVDATTPERETAQSVHGFFLADLLDQDDP